MLISELTPKQCLQAYLCCSYMYYIQFESLVEDHEYDALSKKLLDHRLRNGRLSGGILAQMTVMIRLDIYDPRPGPVLPKERKNRVAHVPRDVCGIPDEVLSCS